MEPNQHKSYTKLVLASNNAGKIRELQALLPGYEVIPQAQIIATEAEETGLTFVENALLKARYAARHCNYPVLADDSGLVVDSLQGVPGIYSARYAGVGASDQANVNKLLLAMEGLPPDERSARFICVLVLLKHANDPTPLIAQGVWEGSITSDPAGEHGFGYDPVFWVSEYGCTSAELTPATKNSLSHRSQALQQLLTLMKSSCK